MDEATKASLRREFTRRFRYALILLPILCAGLLTMWLTDKHHSHFMWLTLLPMLFIAPLYRSYLAIQRLTEPGTSTPSADNSRPVAEKNEFKARMRSKATFGFWITVAIAVLISAEIISVQQKDLGGLSSIDRKFALRDKSTRVSFEYFKYWATQGTFLAAYPPPDCASDHTEWSKNIESNFGFSAFIFLNNRCGLSWSSPAPPAAVQVAAERKIASPDSAKTKPIKSLGAIKVWEYSLKPDSIAYSIWIVERTTDGVKWGAVCRSEQSWLAFFRELSEAKAGFYSPAFNLRYAISLPGDQNSEILPGLRAFYRDSVIFSSPDLDLSRDSIQASVYDGRRIELFAALKDYSYTKQRVFNRVVAIPLTLLPLLLIFPLYRSYRRVRLLTEPE